MIYKLRCCYCTTKQEQNIGFFCFVLSFMVYLIPDRDVLNGVRFYSDILVICSCEVKLFFFLINKINKIC